MNNRLGYIVFKLLLLLMIAAAIYLVFRAVPSFDSLKEKVLSGRKNESTSVSKGTVSDEKLSGKGATFEPHGDRVTPKKRAKIYYPDER